jgi:capsular exopolysaccharide synthesis family protein
MTPLEIDSPPAISREAHLRDYWKIVWQGRWTIVAIFLVVVGGTAFLTLRAPKIYRATATIEVQPQATNVRAGQDVSGLGAAGYGWFAEEKYHNTQVEIIKSREVARTAIETLGLVPRGPDAVSDHELFEGLSLDDTVDAFRGMLQVVPRRETGLIEISMTGTKPEDITNWVNTVADEYVKRNLRKAKGKVEQASTLIEQQFAKIEESVKIEETQRIASLTRGGGKFFNVEEQEQIVQERLKTLNAELTKAGLEVSQLQETLDQIEELPSRGADIMSVAELAQDETLQEHLRSRVDLERKLESAKVDFRPGHPTYERYSNELAKVEQRVRDQISLIVSRLQNRRDLAVEHKLYLERQIQTAEEYSFELVNKTSAYEISKTKADVTKNLFDLITQTMNEVSTSMELLVNNVSILDEAMIPRYPIRPRKRVNLMLGAALGLFLGVAAAFFLDYLDNTFRTPEDIERYLGASVLGVIPKLTTGEGLADRGLREAYQSLRTSIIFSSKNRQRKLILITSTGPQEGKSSTVANLGRTLAANGDRVLIIDCDLRRPTQHVHHNLERDRGMTNYLSGPIGADDWGSYVKTSSPKSLHVLSCGPIPPSPPELLDTDRFSDLLRSASESYDWVLIDSPPASSLADASLLASKADMIVLVVQHNQTDRDLVAKTMQRLRAVNAVVAGAVLNNVDMDRTYHKDYYYAGYYYTDEDGDKRTKKRGRVEAKAKVG